MQIPPVTGFETDRDTGAASPGPAVVRTAASAVAVIQHHGIYLSGEAPGHGAIRRWPFASSVQDLSPLPLAISHAYKNAAKRTESIMHKEIPRGLPVYGGRRGRDL